MSTYRYGSLCVGAYDSHLWLMAIRVSVCSGGDSRLCSSMASCVSVGDTLKEEIFAGRNFCGFAVF